MSLKNDLPAEAKKDISNIWTAELTEYRPMLDYIKNLFDTPELCDVTLLTSGLKIQAHKLILSARSPVFAAMFRHDMKEKEQSEVDISDVDYDVLRELLRFVYTGKTTKLDKMADRLLTAADKYALGPLKDQCEKELCKNITAENAASLLILSDLHGVVALKTQVLDFIGSHAGEVIGNTGYQSMHITHPQLIDEAFQALAKKKAPSSTFSLPSTPCPACKSQSSPLFTLSSTDQRSTTPLPKGSNRRQMSGASVETYGLFGSLQHGSIRSNAN